MTSHRLDEHKCSLNASIATFHHLKLASRLSPGYCCFSCDAIISARDRLKRTDENPGLHTRTHTVAVATLEIRPPNRRWPLMGFASWLMCGKRRFVLFFRCQAAFVACNAICWNVVELQLKSLHEISARLFPWELVFALSSWNINAENFRSKF